MCRLGLPYSDSFSQFRFRITACINDCSSSSMEDSIAFAQTVAYMMNSTHRGSVKQYHFRRNTSSGAQGTTPGPKRPLAAYLLFVTDRHRNGEAKSAAMAQRARADWLALSEDERRIYDERAQREQRKYEAQMKEYMGQNNH